MTTRVTVVHDLNETFLVGNVDTEGTELVRNAFSCLATAVDMVRAAAVWYRAPPQRSSSTSLGSRRPCAAEAAFRRGGAHRAGWRAGGGLPRRRRAPRGMACGGGLSRRQRAAWDGVSVGGGDPSLVRLTRPHDMRAKRRAISCRGGVARGGDAPELD